MTAWSRVLVAASVICMLATACSKSESKQRLRRSRDAAAVVVIGEGDDTAESIVEVEPNNDSSAAQAVTLGGVVSGTLDGSSDVDVYAFLAPATGVLFATLSGIDGVDLTLTVQTPSGEVLAKSDRGPAKTTEGISGFALEAGKTYQVAVAEYLKKSRRKTGRDGKSPPYELALSLREHLDQSVEVEPNDSVDTATELGIDVERAGHVGWAQDVDHWRLGLGDFPSRADAPSTALEPVPGLDLVVTGVDGLSLDLAVLGTDGRVLVQRKGADSGDVALRNWAPDGGLGSVLVRVASGKSNPSATYTLRAEPKPLGVEVEREPNDTAETASLLPDGAGALLRTEGELLGGDVDFFVVEPSSEPRLLDLKVTPPSDADLLVTLVADGGRALAQSDEGAAGVVERLAGASIAAGQRTWLRVEIKAFKQPALYRVSYTLVPGAAPPVDPLQPDLDDLVTP